MIRLLLPFSAGATSRRPSRQCRVGACPSTGSSRDLSSEGKMLRLKDVAPGEMPEVLRVASELYEKDQQELVRAQERQHVVDAAAEVGLPQEYLERAAHELHQRRVVAVVERRQRRTRLVA